MVLIAVAMLPFLVRVQYLNNLLAMCLWWGRTRIDWWLIEEWSCPAQAGLTQEND